MGPKIPSANCIESTILFDVLLLKFRRGKHIYQSHFLPKRKENAYFMRMQKSWKRFFSNFFPYLFHGAFDIWFPLISHMNLIHISTENYEMKGKDTRGHPPTTRPDHNTGNLECIISFSEDQLLLGFIRLSMWTSEISSWTREDKIHIHKRVCNILFIVH